MLRSVLGSHWSPLGCNGFSDFPCLSRPWQFRETLLRNITGCSLLGSVQCLSHDEVRLCVLARGPGRQSAVSTHHIKSPACHHDAYIDLGHLAAVCPPVVSATFSRLSRLHSSEGSHSAQPTLWSCALLPFRMRSLNALPRNFLHSYFVFFPFINAFKNAFMSVWTHMLIYTLCCDLMCLGFPPSFPSPRAMGREPFQLNSMMPWPCLTHVSF